MLHVWETYFKELLTKTEDSKLELPSSVREKTEVVEITDTEMMAARKKMKKGKVVAGSFFQKRDSHNVTYRNGNHKTELDLLVVRKQQLFRIKDCKAIAGNMSPRKSRMQGRKMIRWWKCTEGMIDEYKERVKIKYEELDTEVEAVEEEWKKYKHSFVEVAEEMCGRTSGKTGLG